MKVALHVEPNTQKIQCSLTNHHNAYCYFENDHQRVNDIHYWETIHN
jgi:hypothetical protein